MDRERRCRRLIKIFICENPFNSCHLRAIPEMQSDWQNGNRTLI